MAFQYAPFVNPQVQTITEILARRGDPAARAAEVTAQARARAAEIGGNAWAGAARNIGQDIQGVTQQIEQNRQDAPRRELQGIQIAQAKQSAQDDMLFRHAVSLVKDGDFTPAVSFLDAQGPMGVGAKMKLGSVIEQEQAKHADSAGEIGYQILKNGGTPDAVSSVVDRAVKDKKLTPEQGQQFKVQSVENADKVPDAAKALMRGSEKWRAEADKLPPKVMEADPSKDIINPETGEIIRKGTGSRPDYTLNGRRFSGLTNRPLTEQVPLQTTPAPAQTHNMRLKGVGDVPVDYVPNKDGSGGKWLYQGNDVTGQVSAIPSAATVQLNAVSLSDAALEQAADKYLSSGTLPTGMGGAAVLQRTAIMNRAAAKDPSAALARNQAIFKSDSANLTNLQKTEGTLSAFENTAGRNLDQFLKLADKIPDTGVPWLNTPVRLLTQQAVGSENMAAINAARDVALREIARVTNDPKLSGALTDSARKEVAGLSASNATLPQIKAVVKVLKTDMANVHAGLTQQIDTVKQGIGGNPAAASGAKRIYYDENGNAK